MNDPRGKALLLAVGMAELVYLGCSRLESKGGGVDGIEGGVQDVNLCLPCLQKKDQ
jgi:hypothetical protein